MQRLEVSGAVRRQTVTVYTATGICHTGMLTACLQETSASRWFYYKNISRCTVL